MTLTCTMRNHFMFFSQILVIFLFFGGGWCASIPLEESQAKQELGTLSESVLCKKTLNLSSDCMIKKEAQPNPEYSVLRKFTYACNHAAYLREKICEAVQNDDKLLSRTDGEVQSLISSSNEANATICTNMVETQVKLGYSDKSTKLGHECEKVCVLLLQEETFKFNPLCKFILWSWQFLQSHAKGEQIAVQAPAASPAAKTEKAPNLHDNPQTARVVTSSVQAVPPAVQAATSPQLSKKTEAEQTQMKPDGPEEIIPENTEAEKAKQPDGIAVNSPEEGKAVDPIPVHQANPPSIAGQEETNIDDPQKTPGLLEKSSVKPEEEDSNIEANGDVDDASLGEPTLQKDQNMQAKPQPEEPKNTKEEPLPRDPEPQLDDDDNDNDNMGDADAMPEKDGERGKSFNDQPLALPKYPGAQAVRGSSVDDSEDSHVFIIFVVGTFICVVFYFIYLNKRKIIAMALEGKKGRHSGRRRPTTASYQKLDNKLDEVMASSPQPSKNHVIY